MKREKWLRKDSLPDRVSLAQFGKPGKMYKPSESEYRARLWLLGLEDWQGEEWKRWRELAPDDKDDEQIYKAALQVWKEYKDD